MQCLVYSVYCAVLSVQYIINSVICENCSVQCTGHSESAMVIFAYRSCFGRWQADRVIRDDPNGTLLSVWIYAN